ncbi:hypothetical protein Tco_0422234 [Tanacetum coccineum]
MTISYLAPTPFHYYTTPEYSIHCAYISDSDEFQLVIISDSDNEITTLPIRPAPPSSDRIPALSSYPLDPDDDSSDEDLSETAESLHTHTASQSACDPLPTTCFFRYWKDISMPQGYIKAMDR